MSDLNPAEAPDGFYAELSLKDSCTKCCFNKGELYEKGSGFIDCAYMHGEIGCDSEDRKDGKDVIFKENI